MKEIWKPVKNYESFYQVSNLGNVRSLDRIINQETKWGGFMDVLYRGKNLRKNFDGRVYAVSLYKEGRHSRKRHLIHRLVAQSFIPNPKNKPCINHIDGDPKNNNVNNLEWCTYKENMKHAIDTGLFNIKGEKNVRAKLTTKEALIIKHSKETCEKLSNKFNVSIALVSLIRNNKAWTHI